MGGTRLSLHLLLQTGDQESVAGQDGLPRRRKHIRDEGPRACLIAGALDHRNGIFGDDVEFRWNLDDPYRGAKGRGHIGGIDDAGIGFTQLDLRGDLLDIRLLRDEVGQNAFGKVSAKGGILTHLLQGLAGIIAHRDIFVGQDQFDVGFGQILQRVNARGFLAGTTTTSRLRAKICGSPLMRPIFLRPSHIRLVSRGEDIGACALRQLRPQCR